MKTSHNHQMNTIECDSVGWDHYQALPTMQSQPILDWGIID